MTATGVDPLRSGYRPRRVLRPGQGPNPPKPVVRIVDMMYGNTMTTWPFPGGPNPGPPVDGLRHGQVFPAGRGRLWLIAGQDPDIGPDIPELVMYQGDRHGKVIRWQAGQVTHATLHNQNRWVIDLLTGAQIVANRASCGCGMGAAAHAGPVDSRHQIVFVDPDTLDWVTIT